MSNTKRNGFVNIYYYTDDGVTQIADVLTKDKVIIRHSMQKYIILKIAIVPRNEEREKKKSKVWYNLPPSYRTINS